MGHIGIYISVSLVLYSSPTDCSTIYFISGSLIGHIGICISDPLIGHISLYTSGPLICHNSLNFRPYV